MNNATKEKIDFPRQKVYFEKQSNDQLCGLHCLNSLLQSPLFDPAQLSEIANNLNEMEKKLYSENPDFGEYVKYFY